MKNVESLEENFSNCFPIKRCRTKVSGPDNLAPLEYSQSGSAPSPCNFNPAGLRPSTAKNSDDE